MPMLDLDGEPFHVRLDGPEDGPALMLSNSLATNLTLWDEQVAEWARRFRVIRYDHRGHGGSVAPSGPYSMDQLGRDALAILDRLGIARTHWCGLSMGGMTGMWLLTHAPERLDRVVLANTSAHMPGPDLWEGRIQAAQAGGMEAMAEGILGRWFTPSFRARRPDAVDRVRRMILSTPVEGYVGCCQAIRDMDQREAIRAADRPTLVILGEADPSTTPAMGRDIHAAIRGSRLVALEAAHLSNIERPEAFTEAVAGFLG